MNWDNIRFFLAVARAGSVTSAAREMGVKHSTILRRLDNLEQEVDTRLFSRLSSGYRLTPAGESILVLAEAMEANALSLSRALRGKDSVAEGQVNFTLPANTAFVFDIREIVAEFSLKYPKIVLNIISESEFSDITRLENDVALRVTNEPPAELIGKKVATVYVDAYVSRQHHPVITQNFADYRWILWIMNKKNTQLEEWMLGHISGEQIALRTNDAGTAITAVLQGVGACILPRHVGDRIDGLVRLKLPEIEFESGLWLLTHEDYRGVTRIKVLMDFLQERLPLLFQVSD